MDTQTHYVDSFLIQDLDSAPAVTVSAGAAPNPDDSDVSSGDPDGTDPIGGDSAEDGFPAGVWIAIGTAAVVIAVIAVLMISKSKKKSA